MGSAKDLSILQAAVSTIQPQLAGGYVQTQVGGKGCQGVKKMSVNTVKPWSAVVFPGSWRLPHVTVLTGNLR